MVDPLIQAYAPSPLGGAAPAASAAALPIQPTTAANAPTVYRPSPIDIVIKNESGGRNITQSLSTRDVNNNYGAGGGHPARGVLQIIDPTWANAAHKMGVDLTKYPTAQSAPPALQIEVAKTIPFTQWGPNSVKAVKAVYPDINVHQTLGGVQAQAGGAAPTIPSGAGAAPTAAGAATKQSFADAAKSGNVGAMLQALTAEDEKGKSAMSKLGDAAASGGNAGGQQQQSQGSHSPQLMPNPQPDMSGPAQQLLAQTIQLANKPLTWSAGIPGGGGQQVPGTTLNS